MRYRCLNPWSRVYLSLGSNLSDKKKNLECALSELKRIVKIIQVSSLYESKPWGYKQQDNFYNAVVEMNANLNPEQLLFGLKKIELRLGREKTDKWGPRIIDLDILLYGTEIINSPELKIPHPEMKNRVFVLLPLLELDSRLIDPHSRKKFSESISLLNEGEEVKKIASFNSKKQCWNESI